MSNKFWSLILAVVSVTVTVADVSAAGVETTIDVGELEIRDSIQRGLKFLLRRQRPDGSFHGEPGLRIGVTGLCGLSLLESARGMDPYEKQQAVDHALDFLLARRNENGVFLDMGSKSVSSNHAFATRFLAAAHLRLGEERIPLAVIRRACDALIDGQNADGGWHHQLDQDSISDVTNTACVVAACDDCRRLGIEVPRAVFLQAAVFVESCRALDGEFGYRPLCLKSDPVCAVNGEYCHVIAGRRDASTKTTGAKPDSRSALPNSPLRLYGEYFRMLTACRMSVAAQTLRDGKLGRELSGQQRPDGSWDDPASPEFGTAVAVQILRAGLR